MTKKVVRHGERRPQVRKAGLRKALMAPRHRLLAGELLNGSRALGRALGHVRRGAAAVGMAMKVDAMVAY